KPYLLRSSDRGRSWTSIAGDLPDRDTVYSIQQDHVNADLLFAGTEFGVYFTLDGGEKWIKLKGGMPTIAVRDIAIQRRENDLVLGTFGRSFYILDDYSPLRHATKENLAKNTIFPIKDALRYIQRGSGRGSQGASFYSASNPPFGAVFTYYVKDKLQTLKERRKEAEKKGSSKYPTVDEMRAEDQEQAPAIMLVVRDESGAVVRRIAGSRSKGVHRTAWDLRYPASTPARIGGSTTTRFRRRGGGSGPLALPGTYTVELVKVVEGKTETLAEPVSFNVIPLELATFAAKDREAVLEFQKKVARLQRAVSGATRVAGEAQTRLQYVRAAINETLAADPALLHEAFEMEGRLRKLVTKLSGDRTLSRLQAPVPQSINQRISSVVGSQWNVTNPPTQTQRNQYLHAGTEFTEILAALRKLIEEDLVGLEKKLEAAGAPWTPGRIPEWKMEDD
ncbi:MAG: glycosyl hydrolase, partial [Planctomycetes bacterium]|nr:glycosyl hydrolase [Planctomycetota bacterium]